MDKTPNVKASARLAFNVFKLAQAGMRYAKESRYNCGLKRSRGILVDRDRYAREYQTYVKMRNSAEAFLIKRLDDLENLEDGGHGENCYTEYW